MIPTKLNLACGKYPTDGWYNVDIVDLPGVDKVLDLNSKDWGLPLSHFEEIEARDIIEHLYDKDEAGTPGVVAFMGKCWDILIPGGKIYIHTNDARYPEAWTDPTHTRAFTLETFDFFDPETFLGEAYGFYTDKKFKILEKTEGNKTLGFLLEKI